jgi:hypothetical protein
MKAQIKTFIRAVFVVLHIAAFLLTASILAVVFGIPVLILWLSHLLLWPLFALDAWSRDKKPPSLWWPEEYLGKWKS